jgi:hypothetical protein
MLELQEVPGDLLESAETLHQAVGFLLCGSCPRWMAGKSVDFGHAPVGFGLVRPQGRGFFEITKRI